MLKSSKTATDQLGGAAAQSLPLSAQFAAMIKEASIPKFIAVTLQLGLLLWILDMYAIEERSGLSTDLMYLIFGGFVIHAWLPMKWRMPFFFGLTVAAMVLVFQPVYAAWLVAISLALIGLVHLPVPKWLRLSLVVGAGAVLTAMRAEWITTSWSSVIITVLGSMFMFRLVLYIYDVGNEKKKANIWERLCYFFMLPNVIFPFYPIVDYITYRRTYYNKDAYTIYQKGVLWMLRGAIHLIFYRIVYYHMSPAIEDIQNIGGVVLFITSSYLLYLRISGLFHFIIGLMCMFGFNLPETHKLYFLASGFNDYWRRINIYWKDFMMKIFFYPIFMKTRNWGGTTALVFSTLVVFLFTWLLHSYQWFWLQNHFPITFVDGMYWGVLGVLVAINSVWETKRGKKKKLSKGKKGSWDAGGTIRLALQTTATFVFLSLMWSFWSSKSATEWWVVMSQAGNSTAMEFLWVGLGVTAIFAGIFLWYFLEDNGYGLTFEEQKATFTRTALFTSVGLLALYGIGQPQFYNNLGDRPGAFMASLQVDRMSIKDEKVQERGYYEQLLDNRPQMSALWQSGNKRPTDWQGMVPSGIAKETDNLMYEELRPSIKNTVFKRAPLSTNQWHMRDMEYAKEKPEQTIRMAMLGKSYEMGWGVRNSEVMEQVTEDKLNAEYAAQSGYNYEIMNFSVGGYSIVQYVELSEKSFPEFAPDVVIVTTHAGEGSRVVANILKIYNKGTALPDYLQGFLDRAGVQRDMEYAEQKRRLDELEEDIVRWGYTRMLKAYEEQGVLPIWVFVPRTMGHQFATDGVAENVSEFKRWSAIAEETGFEHLWNLSGTFDEYEEVLQIQLAEWDTHPNALGHDLLGQRFFEVVVENIHVLECKVQRATCKVGSMEVADEGQVSGEEGN
ncbi:MAG: hypothetical protein KTR29_24635 [Rhodothermaceae bacterium]|nr:hypothetical protein [Rhodothermaceae bacterium]